MNAKAILTITLLFTSFALFSHGPIELIITNTLNETQGKLTVEFDKNNDIKQFHWKAALPDQDLESDNFSVEDLQSGSVFKKGSLAKYVKVQGQDFDSYQGGVVNIVVPYNVLKGTTYQNQIQLNRDEEKWVFTDPNGTSIKEVELLVNIILGVPLGIKIFHFR